MTITLWETHIIKLYIHVFEFDLAHRQKTEQH